ncbi:hypothetical protein [uncultured Bartonella sp.]|uniref:hypothetical protein n=1 Tax=uncultured Bartonella sp. TaxID=104108 RepID=UPI00260EC4D4|nr:hypothetical protein [uncultured Bartonella sp.]
MTNKLTFCAVIGLACLTMVQTANASGRNPAKIANMTSEYAGKRCSTPPKGSGIVAGFFRGWEQTPFQNRGSGLMPVERFRCFDTMNECKSWLKTMTYLYNDKTIDASMCTKF